MRRTLRPRSLDSNPTGGKLGRGCFEVGPLRGGGRVVLEEEEQKGRIKCLGGR